MLDDADGLGPGRHRQHVFEPAAQPQQVCTCGRQAGLAAFAAPPLTLASEMQVAAPAAPRGATNEMRTVLSEADPLMQLPSTQEPVDEWEVLGAVSPFLHGMRAQASHLWSL